MIHVPPHHKVYIHSCVSALDKIVLQVFSQCFLVRVMCERQQEREGESEKARERTRD